MAKTIGGLPVQLTTPAPDDRIPVRDVSEVGTNVNKDKYLLLTRFFPFPNTWTPSIQDSSGNSAAVVAGSTSGRYIKLGQLCLAWATLRLAAGGTALSGLTGSDPVRLSLPLAAVSAPNYRSIGEFLGRVSVQTNHIDVVPVVDSGNNYALLYEMSNSNGTNESAITVSDLTTSSVFYYWTMFYMVEP